MSGAYHFMLHKGHLSDAIDEIAERHGCEHMNFTEPNGVKRGWFSCPNLGSPHDAARAAGLRAAIEASGGLEAFLVE